MESLLILGASARAAAQSAARAGFRPYCGDMFHDADLPDTAVGQVVRRFPQGLSAIAAGVPAGPWLYTGGLENHPRLVERISHRHVLLGTAADGLRRVRDPFQCGGVLRTAGLLFPECRPAPNGLPTDGSWLIKHRRSGGGMKVWPWRGGDEPAGNGWYYQERIAGAAHAAVFLAAAGQARLLGVAHQLLVSGEGRPFQYGGSVGPVVLSSGQLKTIRLLGDVLAAQFPLRGLFGVDLIIRDEEVWAIEVNPRYTASVEVLERSLDFNAIEWHVAACRTGHLPPCPPMCKLISGKLVVYAEQSFEVTQALTESLLGRRGTEIWPLLADIPRPGTLIRARQPLMTVFAQGQEVATVQAALQASAWRVGQWLVGSG
jgi:predicted ATP-grasp superfamily ATP-dependent carboligase